MRGGAELLQLLAGEDVDSDQMDLCVTVLSRLGGRHVDDLARAVLDADEAVLPQCRALDRVGERSTGIGAIERMLVLHKTGLAEAQNGQETGGARSIFWGGGRRRWLEAWARAQIDEGDRKSTRLNSSHWE